MPEQAGYRFVPLANQVCPSPTRLVKKDPADLLLSHGQPLADGLCGVIDVTWQAETPFCVGEQDKGREVEGERKPTVIKPFKLGGRHAIPGASLKGMLRSVLEILSFSHLGKINADHRFGFRDYRMNEYTSRVISNDIKAGWLVYDPKGKKWYLAPARGPRGFHYLEIDVIERQLGLSSWKTFKLEDKRGRISRKMGGEKVYFEAVFEKSKSVIDVFSNKPRQGWREGYFAFSGPVNFRSNKKYETIIEAPMLAEHWHPLTEARMKEFSFFNSKVVGDRVEPEESWKYWLDTTGWPEPISPKHIKNISWSHSLPGIPVYYTGDPGSEDRQGKGAFHMGLSRVIKIGYDQSVGQVAARTLEGNPGDTYRVPPLRGKDDKKEVIDFARAIFGDVDEPPKQDEESQSKAEADALKGRVACGFAWDEHEQAQEEDRFHHTVFMSPRASFWPFYLRDQKHFSQGISYNSPLAVLAGRKRYPAREPVISLIQANDKQGNMATDITFLRAGATFQGQIRFHNLHPVELGALLSALALGNKSGPTRHSLGHAKSHGYGRLACECTLTLRPNQQDAAPIDGAECIRRFRCYMQDWYAKAKLPGDWLGSPQVQGLLKMSYPITDTTLRDSLKFMGEVKDFAGFKKGTVTLPDYSREFDRLKAGPPDLGGFLVSGQPCGNGN